MRRLSRTVFAVGSVTLVALASAGPTAGPGALSTIVHHRRVPTARPSRSTSGWASSNWSGYAVTSGTYSSITGKWVVPSVSPSSNPTASSNWIGIDGYNNSSLIQTGTESDYSNGSPRYYAWWEILPAAETMISTVPVRPGDTVSASITKGSGSSWTISITDGSNTFTTTQKYTGPETSAEWIEEATSFGGRIAPLAKYGQTTFDPGTVNGGNPNLTSANAGVMVQKRVQVSTPSTPDADTDGFNVAYGSSAPAPPPS